MCDPATAGLIITAVAGGVSAKNQRDTLKRQDRAAAAGITEQGKNQKEANQRVNEQIQELAGATGEAEQASALADFQTALRSGEAGTEGALDPVAGASDRFAERVTAGKDELKTKAGAKAQRLSVIDGILRQRINEGQDIGRTGGDINAIAGNVRGQDFLTQLRVASERPNANIDALAGIAQGIGSGLGNRPPAARGATINPNTIVDPFNPNTSGTVFG